MSQISTSFTETKKLSLKLRGSEDVQKWFIRVTVAVTCTLFVLTVIQDLLIQRFLAVIAMVPVVIACFIRKRRISNALAIWGIMTLVLATMDLFLYGIPISNPIILVNSMAFVFQMGGSYFAHHIFSPAIQNEQEIFAQFEEKLKMVKEKPVNRFGIHYEALKISDHIGVFRFLSIRNLSLLSCLAPFVFVLLSRTSTFYVANCYDMVDNQVGPGTNNAYCTGNIQAAGINLTAYLWNLPFSVIFDILIARISALLIIYRFLQEILVLHKYRAKLFGAGIKFTNNISISTLVEDYLWNFQSIFMLGLLEYLVPANPTISGLTPAGPINLYIIKNIISVYDTNPPGQDFYANLYTADYNSNDFGTFFGFVIIVLANCSFLISFYGYYGNANYSALLTYFKENDIIELASKWNIKVRYQIENKDNENLKIIAQLHNRYINERVEHFVEALMLTLEENDILKKIDRPSPRISAELTSVESVPVL